MSDPSFDVVSEVSLPEVVNAVAQAQKELVQRFDLKGTAAGIELKEKDQQLVLAADDDFGLKAVNDILQNKLVKRNVPLKAFEYGVVEPATKGTVRQTVKIRNGIETEKAKEIVRALKDAKLKVQAAIQEKQVRVTGKKKDDLQTAIGLLKGKDFGIPIQFTNYRG
jgi:uncharacterized protein YajQ (UPF0234 family)